MTKHDFVFDQQDLGKLLSWLEVIQARSDLVPAERDVLGYLLSVFRVEWVQRGGGGSFSVRISPREGEVLARALNGLSFPEASHVEKLLDEAHARFEEARASAV